jgi:hypothetical protein
VCERFVVCIQHKLAALQKVAEVADPQVAGQQLPVESRVLDLGGVQLLGIEA